MPLPPAAAPVVSSGNDFSICISEMSPATLLVLHALESSLEKSQKALLARDIAGIEASTDEQMRLSRALSEAGFANHSSAQILAALERVRFLGRVSAALLRRIQR